ncbi:MAG: signal peptide peptidase SppA [Bacteroidota bacterium]|nr:signal peptide peptidase SppA [Candidatus Kapabacteria bacterium]MDW8221262.1 signal peptide peptidase SppA [Bacteroidota bacterium]
MDTLSTSQEQAPQYPRYTNQRHERRFRWWIPVVVIVVIVFGFVALIAGALVSLGTLFDAKRSVSVKENSVLYVKLPGSIEERAQDDPLNILISDDTDGTPAFFDILLGIKRAKTDPNIVGILLDGNIRAGGAKLAELRGALEEFKASGKFIYAYIENGSERDYYVASIADSVFMPLEGLLEMNGFSALGVFFKGTLEKIGVEFYVEQFEEYKSAVEPYSRTQYSEPAKQELREVLVARAEEFVRVVSKARSLKPEFVQNVLQRGVYTSDSLLALGFIDGIRSSTTLKDDIKQRIAIMKAKSGSTKDSASVASEKLRLVSISRYINSKSYREAADDSNVDKNKQVAIVFASGTIVSTGDESGQIVAKSFIRSLRKARDNKNVKAIIIRIDSPGGSSFASEEMWEEIRKAAKHKPVYASMSDVAASGGYYMAMACDTIIADANTVTGSIGVLMLLPNATKLLEKIGVSVDTVVTTPSAIAYDPALRLSDIDRVRIHQQSEKIYRNFVQRVAESRRKTFDETRALAKGRVWTGAAARERGLVDTLGGLYTAIGIAKRRLGISDSQRVAIKRYPMEEANRIERLVKRLLEQDDDDETQSSIFSIFRALQAPLAKSACASYSLWNMLPEEIRRQCLYMFELATASPQEHSMTAMPLLPQIR